MALVLDESFVTGIPGSFATAMAQAGTLTATYNSGAQAVDLSNLTAATSFWDITSQPLRLAGEMEIDLEFVADYTGGLNYRHAGVWGVSTLASASNGVRFIHYINGWNLDYWTGALWGGATAYATYQQDSSEPFNTAGDRRVLNMRWDFGSGAGTSRASLETRCNGGLRFVTCINNFPSLRPGVFLWGAAVRLHSIKVWDAPQAPLTPIGSHGLLPLIGRQHNEPPNALGPGVVPFNRAGLLSRRNIYQGGIGRVAGTVRYTPNTPVHRRVRLIDELTSLLVREVWSDPVTGAYSFDYVDMSAKYTVLSYDYTGAYRAVVADGVIPELMP